MLLFYPILKAIPSRMSPRDMKVVRLQVDGSTQTFPAPKHKTLTRLQYRCMHVGDEISDRFFGQNTKDRK